jgi:hypothetical protein
MAIFPRVSKITGTELLQTRLKVLAPAANQGYLPQPPNARDGEIADLMNKVVAERAVAQFARDIEGGHARVLAVFAERMASAAIRNPDPELLRLGLIALLLSFRHDDSREALIVFPLFCNGLRKLKVDQDLFLTEIRETIGDLLVAPLIEFLKRPEADRSLDSMGYSEGADGDGFRFVRRW